MDRTIEDATVRTVTVKLNRDETQILAAAEEIVDRLKALIYRQEYNANKDREADDPANENLFYVGYSSERCGADDVLVVTKEELTTTVCTLTRLCLPHDRQMKLSFNMYKKNETKHDTDG